MEKARVQVHAQAAAKRGLLFLVATIALTLAGCEKPGPPNPLAAGQSSAAWEEPHMRYMVRSATRNEVVFARPLRDKPVPVVLIFHHLPGEPGTPSPRAYETLTNRLIAEGIAVIRVYLDSSTEEFFEIEYHSIDDLLQDARAAFAELEKREFADLTRMGAMGYGIGGGLALTAAANAQLPIHCLVLWSPVEKYEEGFSELLGPNAGKNLGPDEKFFTHFQGRKVSLSSQFFTDIRAYPNLGAEAAQLNIPVLGITGESAREALEDLRTLVKAYQGPEFKTLTVNSADAQLGLDEIDSAKTEEAIRQTVNWFVEQLKPVEPADYSITHQDHS